MDRIYLSSPDVGDLETKYVQEALASGWVSPAGPDLEAFEAQMAERIGVRHSVALSSGTAALHLGLLALNVQPGDVVLTSDMTFAATAYAIAYTGATPLFVDSDPQTGNIDIELLEAAASGIAASGRRIGAVVPVDLLGKCADMDGVEDVASRYLAPVLVDSAESLGATWRGRPAGSFGHASALSFNGNKIMTTSGGGMLLTDDKTLANRARYLSTQARQPVHHYEHTEIGYNYRLSNILAALGRAQLTRLDQMISRRRSLRERYRDEFEKVAGVEILGGCDDSEDNCWLTAIIVEPDGAHWSAPQLSNFLQHAQIETRPLWKPMHLQPVFSGAESVLSGASEKIFGTGLVLPSGSALSDEQIDFVIDHVREFLVGNNV